jgi:dUTPase
VAQLILRRREEATVEVVSELGATVRGAGGFGSSGS